MEEHVHSDAVNRIIAEKNVVESSVRVPENIDRISSLPDCLLVHILSFLKMPDAINTSLLSTSWRYMWTFISCLDFRIDEWELETDRATFIDKSLFNYEGSKIQKVLIWCYYEDTDDIKVDSWIKYVIDRNVEELELDLSEDGTVSEEVWFSSRYKLPQSLYMCSSITSLSLSCCDLDIPAASIYLNSLKILHLELLDLSSETITCLTSNCPVLEILSLHACNVYSDLNIMVFSENLKYLTLSELSTSSKHTKVIIYAPFLVQLNFWNGFPRSYHFKKLSSLKAVSFGELHQVEAPGTVYDENFAYHISLFILYSLYFVQQLWLCMFLVQVMSFRAVQGMHPLYLDVMCLELETKLTRWELPGISYVLKSSPRLESLYITDPESTVDIEISDDVYDEFPSEEKGFWESEDFDFSVTLQNLESVNISFLSGAQQYGNVEEDLNKLETKIEFAQFLLKNSNGLKKMSIICGEYVRSKLELLSKLTEELLIFPKASPNATVVII